MELQAFRNWNEVKGKTQGRPGVRPPVATHAAATASAEKVTDF